MVRPSEPAPLACSPCLVHHLLDAHTARPSVSEDLTWACAAETRSCGMTAAGSSAANTASCRGNSACTLLVSTLSASSCFCAARRFPSALAPPRLHPEPLQATRFPSVRPPLWPASVPQALLSLAPGRMRFLTSPLSCACLAPHFVCGQPPRSDG